MGPLWLPAGYPRSGSRWRLTLKRARTGGKGACLAALLLAAAGCEPSVKGPAATLEGEKLYMDGLGRTVRIPVPARRIVSLAPSNTEILFAIGAGPQVVGRDDNSDYPPEVSSLPSAGSIGGKLGLETLVALRPDLVLAAEIHSAEQVRPIERLGLRVFLLANPKTFDGLQANIRLLGEIAGRDQEARRLADSIRARVEAIAGRVRRAAARPRVFYELDATDATQPWTVGPGTFLDSLIALAGGENIAASSDQPYPRISAETILRRDPEVIILGNAKYGVTPQSVRRRAGWEVLTALRTGRVHAFDADLASRPGPRLADGLEALAKLLHPGAFAE